jgi:ketosteroid isomerase-like protein
MGAQENKQSAKDAYAAFGNGDAEGAMRDMDDGVKWTVRGDSSLTGDYNGKQEVGELWSKMGSKGLRTEPSDFIGDGDTVVVLTNVTLDGVTTETADVLTYNSDGKLVAFETRGDPSGVNSAFPK